MSINRDAMPYRQAVLEVLNATTKCQSVNEIFDELKREISPFFAGGSRTHVGIALREFRLHNFVKEVPRPEGAPPSSKYHLITPNGQELLRLYRSKDKNGVDPAKPLLISLAGREDFEKPAPGVAR